MGKVITKAYVISEFATENRTYREQIHKLSKYKKIVTDEIFQVKRDFHKTIYQAKLEFNIQIIGAGALDQIKAIEEDNIQYDLTTNII